MKILYGKTFGIGNAVMAIPALKALRKVYPQAQIDAMVGSHPDDVGAFDILRLMVFDGTLNNVYRDKTEGLYDIAIMAIPFDGRWQNGIHYQADKVFDGRTRPDPATTGLVSWKKHEAQYQIDNVRELGYVGETPDCSIDLAFEKENNLYLGVGYKKDAAGFWKVKHFGNENFAELLNKLFEANKDIKVIATGDIGDIQFTLNPIKRLVNNQRFIVKHCNIINSIGEVAKCKAYFGNDTGMAHIAAAMNTVPIVAYFMEGSSIKNPPFTSKCYNIIWHNKDKKDLINFALETILKVMV
jgi:ADP-heptose:LPS heptosyltransferase